MSVLVVVVAVAARGVGAPAGRRGGEAKGEGAGVVGADDAARLLGVASRYEGEGDATLLPVPAAAAAAVALVR